MTGRTKSFARQYRNIWLAFNSPTSSLPAGGTMYAVVPDDLVVGRSAEYVLCVSLDTADFERLRSILELATRGREDAGCGLTVVCKSFES